MRNIMLLGDSHGDRAFVKSAIEWAADNDIDCIVQMGDFGFWPRINNGQKFLYDVGKLSVTAHVPLYFIDGNHEDHIYLDAMRERNRSGGFIEYGKYPITYIDRGTTWKWGGVRFGAFGGAYSIDRRARVMDDARYGWFDNEMPDESKIKALGKVDVLLTHDSPVVPAPFYDSGGFRTDEISGLSQRAVYRALVSSEATLLVHGHWHMRYSGNVAGARVHGLGMNLQSLYEAAVVYTTTERRLYSLGHWEYREQPQDD